MKVISFTLLCLLFYSCSTKFEVEDRLFNCLRDKYAEKGIDLDHELSAFEKVLLDAGEVKNNDGSSYFDLYSQLVLEGKLNTITHEHFDTQLNKSIGLDSTDFSNCLDFESELFKSSKSYELTLAIDSFVVSNKADFQKLFSLIKEVLDKETLNHPYFKAKNLINIASQITKEPGLLQVVPNKMKDNVDNSIKVKSVVDVMVRSDSEILLNGELINLDSLSVKLKEILQNKSGNKDWPENRVVTIEELENFYKSAKLDTSKKGEKKVEKASLLLRCHEIFQDDFKKNYTVVNCQTASGVTYDLYLQIKDALKESYQLIREELGLKHFGRTWADLTSEEKSMLKLVVKESISEAPILK